MPRWVNKNNRSWKGQILQARSNSTNYLLAGQKKTSTCSFAGLKKNINNMDTSFYILPARWMKHPFFCNIVWHNWVFSSPHIKTPQSSHLQTSNDQEGCPRTGGCMNTYRDGVTGERLTVWKQSVAIKYCYPPTRLHHVITLKTIIKTFTTQKTSNVIYLYSVP